MLLGTTPPNTNPTHLCPPSLFQRPAVRRREYASLSLSLARSLTRMARNLLSLASLARSLEGLATCCISPLSLARSKGS